MFVSLKRGTSLSLQSYNGREVSSDDGGGCRQFDGLDAQ